MTIHVSCHHLFSTFFIINDYKYLNAKNLRIHIGIQNNQPYYHSPQTQPQGPYYQQQQGSYQQQPNYSYQQNNYGGRPPPAVPVNDGGYGQSQPN